MEEKVTPGVILASRFVFSEQKFQEYIEYIDRPEAVRSDAYFLYSVFTDYMDNPEKQQKSGLNTKSDRAAALFTATKDTLTRDEKEELKSQFLKAQRNGSPMWQNVISFTNGFLEQNGLFDKASGLLDEDKMHTVTRLAMTEMLRNEHMEASAVWSASIHYNTDNIHIHIAVVEPIPTRKKKEILNQKEDGTIEKTVQFKGSLQPSTFLKMKSKVVNNIVDREPELSKINDIIRKNIVAEKRDRLTMRDQNLRGAFLNLYRQMPPDKQMWFYNMNALKNIRPEIDKFTRLYIGLYHKKDFAELSKRLQEQQEFLKSIYGSGKQELYKNYASTKVQDLYTRMGNAVLTELRKYDKTIRSERTLPRQKIPAGQKLREKKHLVGSRLNTINELKKAMKKDFSEVKNQIEYEKLQQNIEFENDRQV